MPARPSRSGPRRRLGRRGRGRRPLDDLAILRAEETDGLESLELGSQDSISQGDQVVAVGYPTNASPNDELQATEGIVSVVEQTFDVPNDPFVQLYPNVIQTDAPIDPATPAVR